MTYPFADKPDEDLARAAREGDDAARDRLLGVYRDALFTCVVRLTGSSERAESALVRGFVRWFCALRRALPPQGIRGSMYQMALGVARKVSKESRPDIARSPRAVGTRAAELAACGAQVEPESRPAQLQWLLASLPLRSRQLLVLVDVMGMSDEQAAFLLGMKPPDVPAALARASRDLLGAYLEYGPPHDPSATVVDAELRAELRAMGWETAPWHFTVSVRQELLRLPEGTRGRGRTLAILAALLIVVLIILWVVL